MAFRTLEITKPSDIHIKDFQLEGSWNSSGQSIKRIQSGG